MSKKWDVSLTARGRICFLFNLLPFPAAAAFWGVMAIMRVRVHARKLIPCDSGSKKHFDLHTCKVGGHINYSSVHACMANEEHRRRGVPSAALQMHSIWWSCVWRLTSDIFKEHGRQLFYFDVFPNTEIIKLIIEKVWRLYCCKWRIYVNCPWNGHKAWETKMEPSLG